MSLTRRRVHNAAADMTELFNLRPVHLDEGRARATKDGCPSSRAAQFSKTVWRGATGLVASTPCSGHEKRPLVARGPIRDRRRLRLVMDSSLRGCSSSEPLQERPPSIARDPSEVE